MIQTPYPPKPTRTFLHLACMLAIVCIASFGCGGEQTGFQLRVQAGEVDRTHSIVSFDVPGALLNSALVLRDIDDNEAIPVQIHAGKGWFILEDLSASASKTYSIELSAHDEGAAIEASEDSNGVSFSLAGQPIFRYNGGESPLPRNDIAPIFKRGGYIHPVYTPSSQLVTNDYPPNHVHHHGIWAAWTNTIFQGRTPDFWNMGDSTGTVIANDIDEVWAGPVLGGFKSRHAYIDLSATPSQVALNESWTGRVFNVRDVNTPYHLFDLTLSQESATDSALTLPEYRYGGLGFRGHDDWEGPDNTYFLTSEGKDRSNGHATRARWCHIGGEVDGKLAGVAILSHPDNFRFPEPMRIHPTEPFFNWAPSQAGDWTISNDRPFKATYRFVVMDGPPDADLIDQLWEDFAYPATATTSRL